MSCGTRGLMGMVPGQRSCRRSIPDHPFEFSTTQDIEQWSVGSLVCNTNPSYSILYVNFMLYPTFFVWWTRPGLLIFHHSFVFVNIIPPPPCLKWGRPSRRPVCFCSIFKVVVHSKCHYLLHIYCLIPCLHTWPATLVHCRHYCCVLFNLVLCMCR